ncbi:hypothetical protein HMPREF9065_01816 [Aggregatibacter sp. oral taxon 458 str. W10330]|nr:hypothetical protein HMPREF9065_01816 [Aggregatibacter sp. oral taxon 458 str. W10330]
MGVIKFVSCKSRCFYQHHAEYGLVKQPLTERDFHPPLKLFSFYYYRRVC